MTQPFADPIWDTECGSRSSAPESCGSERTRLAGACWRGTVWPAVTVRLLDDAIVIDGAGSFLSLASAVLNGGLTEADIFLNRKVPLSYDCGDPAPELGAYAQALGKDPARTVGMMTAARLNHASVQEEASDACRLVVVTTAGIGNAARAGSGRRVFPTYRPGTINTVVLIDGRLAESAMVNAVMTATEAKAAALQTLGVIDPETGLAATGTTTDALAVAQSRSAAFGVVHDYAGTASMLGGAIGRLVYASVLEAVSGRPSTTY